MSEINDMIKRLTPRQQREFALRCAGKARRGKVVSEGEVSAWYSPLASAESASAAAATAVQVAARTAAEAERAWQREELERMLGEGGGAWVN